MAGDRRAGNCTRGMTKVGASDLAGVELIRKSGIAEASEGRRRVSGMGQCRAVRAQRNTPSTVPSKPKGTIAAAVSRP